MTDQHPLTSDKQVLKVTESYKEQAVLFVCNDVDDEALRFNVPGFKIRRTTYEKALAECLTESLSGVSVALLNEPFRLRNAGQSLQRFVESSRVPIVCTSKQADATDCIVAFELGVDDFLRTPIEDRELAARLNAIIRRFSKPNGTATLVADDIQLFKGKRSLSRNGEDIHLTSVEFDILALLLESRGRLVTRATISRSVLGDRTQIRNRSIDVHISSIRKKLGMRNGGARIKTIRGEGYVYLQ